MQFSAKVQEALRHVNSIFPEVIQVFYGIDGRWMFCDDNFDGPNFHEEMSNIDIGLLEDASDAAADQKGLPCAYRLFNLSDYYALWDELGNIPVSEGSDQVEVDTIEEKFLHFPVGTHREEIWKWFENQHKDFFVGEVMQGIRKPD